VATGTVKWSNGQKGYGFIQPDAGGKAASRPMDVIHFSIIARTLPADGLNRPAVVAYFVGWPDGQPNSSPAPIAG
jgi:'Cold-shock' DNA-binding domain